jgi:hypothetical protein
MQNNYPASGANCEGSNYISNNAGNNVGLQGQAQQASYINGTNQKATHIIL